MTKSANVSKRGPSPKFKSKIQQIKEPIVV